MQSVPQVAGTQWEFAPPGSSLNPTHWVPTGQTRQPVQTAPCPATSQQVDHGGAQSNVDPLLRRFEQDAGIGWQYTLVRLEPPLGATDNTWTVYITLQGSQNLLVLATVEHVQVRQPATMQASAQTEAAPVGTPAWGPQRTLHTRPQGPHGRPEPLARPSP